MPVDPSTLSRILSTIASPPGLREQPRPDDLQGNFHMWFDGGAIRIVTGWEEFHFGDGTLAVLSGSLLFGLSIRLPSGTWVTIKERAEESEGFPHL
jgi:hypothetical protein